MYKLSANWSSLPGLSIPIPNAIVAQITRTLSLIQSSWTLDLLLIRIFENSNSTCLQYSSHFMSNIYVSNWIANLILKRISFFTIVLLLQIINNDNRLKFTFLYRQGRRGRGATWFRFRSTRWQRPRTRFERGNTRCRIDACNDPKEPNIIT